MPTLPLALGAGFLLAASSGHAALTITNGTFDGFIQGPSQTGTNATVADWFTVTTGDFFANTWHDVRPGPTAGFSGGVAAFSGFNGGALNGYLYQSMGTDAAVSTILVSFDWGDFGDYGSGNDRALGLTVGIYEWDGIGAFTAGNDTDLEGAAGVTLLDSASVELLPVVGPGKLSIGETVSLDLSAQSGGELFLRVNNFSAGGGDPWLMVDNIAIIPEPSSALIGGLGLICLLRRRRA